jgi:cytochrome c5
VKKLLIAVLGTVFLVCSWEAIAQTPAAPKNTTPASAKKHSANEGEKKFQQNCGRCHNPPDLLSPREVKAVLQHMRVRANLSAEDEQLILKYLAP